MTPGFFRVSSKNEMSWICSSRFSEKFYSFLFRMCPTNMNYIWTKVAWYTTKKTTNLNWKLGPYQFSESFLSFWTLTTGAFSASGPPSYRRELAAGSAAAGRRAGCIFPLIYRSPDGFLYLEQDFNKSCFKTKHESHVLFIVVTPYAPFFFKKHGTFHAFVYMFFFRNKRGNLFRLVPRNGFLVTPFSVLSTPRRIWTSDKWAQRCEQQENVAQPMVGKTWGKRWDEVVVHDFEWVCLLKRIELRPWKFLHGKER